MFVVNDYFQTIIGNCRITIEKYVIFLISVVSVISLMSKLIVIGADNDTKRFTGQTSRIPQEFSELFAWNSDRFVTL